jgi:hypothetical protein
MTLHGEHGLERQRILDATPVCEDCDVACSTCHLLGKCCLETSQSRIIVAREEEATRARDPDPRNPNPIRSEGGAHG